MPVGSDIKFSNLKVDLIAICLHDKLYRKILEKLQNNDSTLEKLAALLFLWCLSYRWRSPRRRQQLANIRLLNVLSKCMPNPYAIFILSINLAYILRKHYLMFSLDHERNWHTKKWSILYNFKSWMTKLPSVKYLCFV